MATAQSLDIAMAIGGPRLSGWYHIVPLMQSPLVLRVMDYARTLRARFALLLNSTRRYSENIHAVKGSVDFEHGT